MSDLPRDQARKLLFNARAIALANEATALYEQARALKDFVPEPGDVTVLEEMLRDNQAKLKAIADEIDTELEAAFEPLVNASIMAGEALQDALARSTRSRQ